MPNPQPTLPQQYGRFLVSGALVFILFFWGLSAVLVSSHDAHLDFLALRLIFKGLFHQPFSLWLDKVEVGYMSFFLRQRPLLACYMVASSLAWLAAFLHDTKVMRKENTL
ncbi:MAG TPA: hypothetical protein VI685_20165 [Candidatus Angelobacter sp.]